MKENNLAFSLLALIALFILIVITNTQTQLFTQMSLFASTEEQNKGKERVTFENDNGTNAKSAASNDEPNVFQDQNQVQQPQQIDTISPKVLSVTPNYGTSGIPVTTKITATFSEPVDALTLDYKTFTLQTDDNEVKGTTSLSSDGTIATFTPSSSLSNSTIYTASISEVKDLAGNTMSYASPWSFTTEAQAAPPSQQAPPQTQPSNPGGGGSGNSGSNTGGGGIFGDIKTSPSESGVLKDAAQYVEDEKLVDRILPIILSKMDKRQLATTVLPYLDLQISVRQVEGETTKAQGGEAKDIKVSATCSQEEILIGGAFATAGGVKITGSNMEGNQWSVYSDHSPYYSVTENDISSSSSKAICMTINLVPKDPNAPTLTNGSP